MFKILIRPLIPQDADLSWKWRNDKEVWKYTGNKPDLYITKEIEQSWINRVIKEEDSKRFAILVDDIYVGNIQLTNVTSTDAQYHIFIGEKKYWGKGIANNATYQILYYAKEVLKLDSVYLYVNDLNKSAIRVYEKQGFTYSKSNNSDIRMECDLSNLSKPRLSIFCMVYNHELNLKKCLEGFLMQKTNFNFDIVVGEDFSNDNSREILLNYSDKYPGKFKLILHKTNVGAIKNQNATYLNCNGKYIALCEGDDYWTDPLKLQKQVDFLEANPEYSLCYHRVNIDYGSKVISDAEDITEKRYNKIKDKSTLSRMELLKYGNFIHTVSVVFRKSDLGQLPFELQYSSVGDYFLYIILTDNQKKIHRMNHHMAAYRRGVGVYSSLNSVVMSYNILQYKTCILSYLIKEDEKNIILNQLLHHLDKIKKRELSKRKIKDFTLKNHLSEIYKKIKRRVS